MLKHTIGKLAAGSLIAATGALSMWGVASAATDGTSTGGHMIASSASTVASVDCGSIDTPNGTRRFEVIADSTPAGRVGCTDAFNVLDVYLHEAPYSQGTAHAMNIDGWTCVTDGGAYGSGRIGCEKDGLAFHADPIA